MEAEEINQKIAEICGWAGIHGATGIHPRETKTIQPATMTGPDQPPVRVRNYLPDYVHSLDAMLSAEATLKPKGRVLYSCQLAVVCFGEHATITPERVFFLIHASAAQKAEAFLAIHGRWRERERFCNDCECRIDALGTCGCEKKTL